MEKILSKNSWADNIKRQIKPKQEEIEVYKLDYLLEEIKSEEFYEQQRGISKKV